jgi:hypothetical protein
MFSDMVHEISSMTLANVSNEHLFVGRLYNRYSIVESRDRRCSTVKLLANFAKKIENKMSAATNQNQQQELSDLGRQNLERNSEL